MRLSYYGIAIALLLTVTSSMGKGDPAVEDRLTKEDASEALVELLKTLATTERIYMQVLPDATALRSVEVNGNAVKSGVCYVDLKAKTFVFYLPVAVPIEYSGKIERSGAKNGWKAQLAQSSRGR